MHADVPTLWLASIILGVILTFSVAFIGSRRDRTLSLWALAFALHTLAFMLLALQGKISDFSSKIVANTALSAMFGFLIEGLLRFQGRSINRLIIWFPVALTAFVFSVFLENMTMRVILGGAILTAQIVFTIVILLQKNRQISGRGKYLIILGLCWAAMILGIRVIATTLGFTEISDLRHSSFMQTLTFLTPVITLSFFAMGIIAMTMERAEEKLKEVAFFDPLTLLPNRRLMEDRLSIAIANCMRHKSFGAIMLIDIDYFKVVNDEYGHAIGDGFLIEIATRIKKCLRKIDTIARIGGDEFVVILNSLDKNQDLSRELAYAIAEKIRIELSKTYKLALNSSKTINHESSCSIGITLFKDDTIPQTLLFKVADQAMYLAKDSGKNAINFQMA